MPQVTGKGYRIPKVKSAMKIKEEGEEPVERKKHARQVAEDADEDPEGELDDVTAAPTGKKSARITESDEDEDGEGGEGEEEEEEKYASVDDEEEEEEQKESPNYATAANPLSPQEEEERAAAEGEQDEGIVADGAEQYRPEKTPNVGVIPPDQLVISHGKFLWRVDHELVVLWGKPVVFPDGKTYGKIRISRSADAWGPYISPKHFFALRFEGVVYLYVIMCVDPNNCTPEQYAMDSRRLRHIPTIVAEGLVSKMKEKIPQFVSKGKMSAERQAELQVVVDYVETEQQQIEPRAARLAAYKLIKLNKRDLPTAEIDHVSTPRSSKKGGKGGGDEADDNDSSGTAPVGTSSSKSKVAVSKFAARHGAPAGRLSSIAVADGSKTTVWVKGDRVYWHEEGEE